MIELLELLDKLGAREPSELVCNFYSNSKKRLLKNLETYFNCLHKPVCYMLVGEAPGYKGCACSGIPFTSQRILREHKFFSKKKIAFIF